MPTGRHVARGAGRSGGGSGACQEGSVQVQLENCRAQLGREDWVPQFPVRAIGGHRAEVAECLLGVSPLSAQEDQDRKDHLEPPGRSSQGPCDGSGLPPGDSGLNQIPVKT